MLDAAKEAQHLFQATLEAIELAKDFVVVKVELLALGHILQPGFGLRVPLLVAHVQVDALLHHLHGFRSIAVPQRCDALALVDLALAAVDKLVGDAGEQVGHADPRAVMTREGVDHLHAVHDLVHGFSDLTRLVLLEALHQREHVVQETHVVFGLVQVIGNGKVNFAPLLDLDLGPFALGCCLRSALVIAAEGTSLQDASDHTARLVLELLGDADQGQHAARPVLDLNLGSVVACCRQRSVAGVVFDVLLDSLTPLFENLCEVLENFGVFGRACICSWLLLDLVVRGAGHGNLDVSTKVLDFVLQIGVELVHLAHEHLVDAVFLGDGAPLVCFAEHRLVDRRNLLLEGSQQLIIHFTAHARIVRIQSGLDWLVAHAEEIEAFALELFAVANQADVQLGFFELARLVEEEHLGRRVYLVEEVANLGLVCCNTFHGIFLC